MKSPRSAISVVILLVVALLSPTSPASADLVLVAGGGPATIAVNNFGFSGTYFDMYGKNGASEDIAHPGGGPVAFLHVVNADTSISTYFDAKAGPYDGSDDTQVAVLNNSAGTLNSLALGGGNVNNIFSFDGDGIGAAPYNAPTNAKDTSDGHYGGPLTFFTNINAAGTAGTANFVGGLAPNGGSTYFSAGEPAGDGVDRVPSGPVLTGGPAAPRARLAGRAGQPWGRASGPSSAVAGAPAPPPGSRGPRRALVPSGARRGMPEAGAAPFRHPAQSDDRAPSVHPSQGTRGGIHP